jgi:pyridoxamine 5'-phosphate oxidase
MSSRHEFDSDDPLQVFDSWISEAGSSEPNDPNAAALATSTIDGKPSVRMVLAKRVADHRFSFFTNVESRKGRELRQNPRAALCFHWKTLRRQVRVEGDVLELDSAEVDAYFHSRSRASQISAAVSDQSRVLNCREELEERVRIFAETNPGAISKPEFWRGFYLREEQIEFWIDGAHRLHDRFLFTRTATGWQKKRLFP